MYFYKVTSMPTYIKSQLSLFCIDMAVISGNPNRQESSCVKQTHSWKPQKLPAKQVLKNTTEPKMACILLLLFPILLGL